MADARRDPRPNRVIRLLQEHHEVFVLGRGGSPPGTQFLALDDASRGVVGHAWRFATRLLGLHAAHVRSKFASLGKRLADVSPDLIVVHDLLLAVALRDAKHE
jgi:hypothetical protein